MLILTYRKTGSAIGPGAVFAARALPSLVVGTVLSGRIEQPERRTGLVAFAVIGAIATALVAAEPTLLIALLATALLGANRTSALSVTAGAIVDSVPGETRAGYFALSSMVNQASQVVGFLAGTALTLWLGVRFSLGFDSATFVIGAVILAGLPKAMKKPREQKPFPTAGIRTLLDQPVLRLIAPIVWIGVCGTALPETIAPTVSHGPELAVVMCSFPLGTMIAATYAAFGEGGVLNRVVTQLRVSVLFGMAFGLGAVVLWLGGGDWLLAAANLVLGAASVWVIGVRTTFARYSPPGRMVQVEAVMVAAIVLGEGVGTLALAFAANAAGADVSYGIVGGLTTCMAAYALSRRHRVPGLDADVKFVATDGVDGPAVAES